MEKAITDKRYIKSKQAIEKAIEKLYFTGRTITSITVSEITKLANIARKTFYLHYVDLNDFFNQSINEKINNLSKTYLKTNTTDFYETLSTFFVKLTVTLKENNMIKMLLSNEQYSAIIFDKLKVAIKNFMAKHPNSPCRDEYGLEFFTAGTLYTYSYWLKKTNNTIDMQEIQRDIASFTAKLKYILKDNEVLFNY